MRVCDLSWATWVPTAWTAASIISPALTSPCAPATPLAHPSPRYTSFPVLVSSTSRKASFPSTVTAPTGCMVSPAAMRRRELFPAPLAPSSKHLAPRGKQTSSTCKAGSLVPGYVIRASRSSTDAVAMTVSHVTFFHLFVKDVVRGWVRGFGEEGRDGSIPWQPSPDPTPGGGVSQPDETGTRKGMGIGFTWEWTWVQPRVSQGTLVLPRFPLSPSRTDDVDH
eukprot:scaffold626_cov337-Pavlova_lutheri.AAC.46